jgi:glutamine synthetase
VQRSQLDSQWLQAAEWDWLAPRRVVWLLDNKGAMCRLVMAWEVRHHIENRSGEPAANLYL